VQTALREAQEEIGLPPEAARPIGFLDRMDTISDYRVLPVVALVAAPVKWVLDHREVSEVFTIPVSVALDRQQYEGRSVTREGQTYTIWSMDWEGYNVWGTTAAMLMNLIARMENLVESEDPAIRCGA
jgi:8-oxo-dGTP pyrophosphatase MutT (NUDIX family)